MPYEVQHDTLCDAWVNTWTVHNEDQTSYPETFATREDAQAALGEFLKDIQDEIAAGQRLPDEGYDSSEFRIVDAGAR